MGSAGKPFGRYLLLDALDRGGMAEVYRAVMHGPGGFQRQFVVKRIRKEKADSRDFVDMFVNEARISAMLDHPNIVQIFDFGQVEGDYFLSMEYLRGKNLLAVARKLRGLQIEVPTGLAAYVTQQVARGLHYAHALAAGGKSLSIVHRDVTPSNIFLLRTGGVKLLDFGIARAEMKLRSVTPTGGLIKGKFAYMSPEQVRGTKLDGRSDIFSLGVVLWECLTGKRLFWNQNETQIMRNVLGAPIPRPSEVRPGLPPELDDVVMRALARDVGTRYSNAGALAADLEPYLREARFSPDEQVKLLEDLFGDDDSFKEMVLPEDTAVGPVPTPSQVVRPAELAADDELLPVDVSPVEEQEPEDGDGAYTSVSVAQALPARRPWAIRPIALVVGGLAAAAGIAFALVPSSGRPASPAANVSPTRATSTPQRMPENVAVAPPHGEPSGKPLMVPPPPDPTRPPPVPAAPATPPPAASEGSREPGEPTGTIAPSDRERSSRHAARQRRAASRALGASSSNPELARGLAALRAGQLKLAQQELEAAVEADLTSPSAVGALADVEFELGLHARALLHARRAAQLAPTESQYRVLEGDLCLKVGRPSEAVIAYKIAARLAPRDPAIGARLSAAEERARR